MAKDKTGNKIYPDDIVQFTTQDLAGEYTGTGIVSSIYEDDKTIQVIPETGESSLPIEIESSNATVIRSLRSEILNLASFEEFQRIMREAEARYLKGQTSKPRKKREAKTKNEAGPDLSFL